MFFVHAGIIFTIATTRFVRSNIDLYISVRRVSFILILSTFAAATRQQQTSAAVESVENGTVATSNSNSVSLDQFEGID